jgi:hypothetical protein
MDQLWMRMQAIYSGLWRSMNNSSDEMRRVAQREWLDAIRRAGLSWNEVSAAIDACAAGDKAKPGMPPTLPDFVALARPATAPAHKPFAHLPRPAPPTPRQKSAQRAAGSAELAKMKAMLGGAR